MRRRVVIPMLGLQSDAPGGSARIAWDEAMQLARLGHDVWVVAPDVVGGAPEREEHDGIHILRYSLPDHAPMNPRRGQPARRLGACGLSRP